MAKKAASKKAVTNRTKSKPAKGSTTKVTRPKGSSSPVKRGGSIGGKSLKRRAGDVVPPRRKQPGKATADVTKSNRDVAKPAAELEGQDITSQADDDQEGQEEQEQDEVNETVDDILVEEELEEDEDEEDF